MPPPETCDKHDATMDRIFSTLNAIQQDQAATIASQKNIEKFAADIHKIVYGNGQEGLISKVRRVLSQVNLQWGLLLLILGGMIGFGIKYLIK